MPYSRRFCLDVRDIDGFGSDGWIRYMNRHDERGGCSVDIAMNPSMSKRRPRVNDALRSIPLVHRQHHHSRLWSTDPHHNLILNRYK